MRISQKLPLLFVSALLFGMFGFAGSAMASFGLERFALGVTNRNGTPDVQAGSHPYALTNTFVLNRSTESFRAPGDLKDVKLELPPGFAGDPNALPKCKYQAFLRLECPNETAIGITATFWSWANSPTIFATHDPLYNLEPPAGVAAQFGFLVAKTTPVFLNTTVRTGGDYGLTTTVSDLSQAIVIYANKVTTWGVPADPIHNDVRGGCLLEEFGTDEDLNAGDGLGPGEEEEEGAASPPGSEYSGQIVSAGECPTQAPEIPLLTNPTSCGEPRTAIFGVDSWEEPGVFSSKSRPLPELSGCEKLDFSPTIDVTPDGTAGSTPTGLNIGLHVPQESSVQNPVGLAEAAVKDTTVTLPAGVQLNPSAGDGLQACSNEQIGFKGVNPVSGMNEFTSGSPSCPDASKVANVKIKTPLLEHELEGSVYLAAPQNFAGSFENPFGSLVALYLVAEEPIAGVLIKIAGKVSPDPVSGQLTSTFENTPQLPFSELKLEFYGTDRAPLATPGLCGTYKTETSFVPWSGTPPVDPSSSFQITSGPNGSSCSAGLSFSPYLESGTTNIDAGAYTPLTTTMSREDGQQSIQSVQLHYPPGVSGLLTGVKLCPEAQADAGTCSPESEIGETIVSVGLGNDPFSVTGGKVYITEKYDGAPFGLSIVNPAKAGPFDLQEGRPVVVRAKLEVNPINAALTVTTNSSGPYSIPHIIDGIPLQIKHVNVTVNRPGFTFNPTNCTPAQVTGTINSAEGSSSPVSVPFQVTNCGVLGFKPGFDVSTSGKTSRANGASLTVKLSYPKAPFGSQANIKSVKVDLPKQLPSRLTTLQKACTAAQFEANPAGCPAASIVGRGTAITPLIPVPLSGPAYFVSHGGAKFPELVIVLQGYGVTLDLHGETFISKAGITSSTFHTVPDAPVGGFELTLPQGSDSALAANGNLCASKLAMPTAFTAQNGLEIHESTPIAVTGCAKVKTLSRAQKLATALKACKRDKSKAKGASCERRARKEYGPVKTKKKK
jgi:hypothetical protein